MKKFINSKIFLYLAWAGRIILIAAVFYIWLTKDTQGIFTITPFLFVAFVPLFLKNLLPPFYDTLIVFMALINAGAWIWNAYETVFFYDEFAHAFTTFTLTLVIGHISINFFSKDYERYRRFILLSIVSFGISLGTIWEFWEWMIDIFIEKSVIAGLYDTITDLMWDSLGALCATGILLLFKRK